MTIHSEYWEHYPEWITFVNNVWKGDGRVEQIKDDLRIIPFRRRAERAFTEYGLTYRYVKTWVSCQVPCHEDGYAQGYPHVHYPLDATTLVHYLYPGDRPAPLDIFEGDEVIETIYPKTGLTVFMPNNVKHGVRNNYGSDNRLALIATAIN